jgi:hypothetical protein
MSPGIGHFAVGATCTLLFLLVTGLHARTRHDGLLAIGGGLWAIVPDAGSVLPGVGSLDSTPLANLFWFHYHLDVHRATDSLTAGAAFVAAMTVTVVGFWLVDRGVDSRTEG